MEGSDTVGRDLAPFGGLDKLVLTGGGLKLVLLHQKQC
jgi:hypothetical protein